MTSSRELVNDPDKPTAINVAPRPGFFPWHDENCIMELEWGHECDSRGAYKRFWCRTHGQWCYETSVKTIHIFEDGEEVTT